MKLACLINKFKVLEYRLIAHESTCLYKIFGELELKFGKQRDMRVRGNINVGQKSNPLTPETNFLCMQFQIVMQSFGILLIILYFREVFPVLNTDEKKYCFSEFNFKAAQVIGVSHNFIFLFKCTRIVTSHLTCGAQDGPVIINWNI